MSATSADVLRRELRVLQASGIDAWVERCDEAVRAAQRRGDGQAVAELSILAAVGLDARGRLAAALERLDVGLRWVGAGTDAHAHLWLVRSGILGLAGQMTAAWDALARADRVVRPLSPRARLERRTYHTLVPAMALEPVALENAQAVALDAQRAGFDWLASGLVVWLIPWVAAHGFGAGAQPWIDWLRVIGERSGHPNRVRDAEAFARLLGADAQDPRSAPPPPSANNFAAWRVDLFELRHALLRAELDRAGERLGALERRIASMNPGFRDGSASFAAVLRAYSSLSIVGFAPPEARTLVSLPAWIAGAEAVAMAGARIDAVRWRDALRARIPDRVQTSLEWPASLVRVRGLLALRAGDSLEAARFLTAAAGRASNRHPSLEASLAALQLAEFRSPASSDGRRSVARARHHLHEAGVLTEVHVAAVRRASAQRTPASTLTPRELEVLLALEEGLTYRQIGERLGMHWRTAQTHAYRVYRKLGASGRRAAVTEAHTREAI
ncbi:MAG: LuxR C-terminal-related transcriptional regulator [Dehalococcoidia bacterium]